MGRLVINMAASRNADVTKKLKIEFPPSLYTTEEEEGEGERGGELYF